MICLDVSQHWLGRGEFERTFHPNPVADKARSDSFYRKSAVFSCHSFGRQSRFDSNPPSPQFCRCLLFKSLAHVVPLWPGSQFFRQRRFQALARRRIVENRVCDYLGRPLGHGRNVPEDRLAEQQCHGGRVEASVKTVAYHRGWRLCRRRMSSLRESSVKRIERVECTDPVHQNYV